MATRKAATKTARATKAGTAAKTKPAKKTTHKTPAKSTQRRKKPASRAANGAGPAASAGGQGNAGAPAGNIRVRMYRVGFGDFFLLTVPGKNGPAHILIDCGVHAANIGTIEQCVEDMAKETGRNLALVILTHYHADHMSGFATCSGDFAQFSVGAV